MIFVHVDVSFNGFLRRWGLERFKWANDQLISWRYVQPLSLEEAGETDAVSLSVTLQQIKELPGEDLADAIETLSGQVQHAVFSALDSEKASMFAWRSSLLGRRTHSARDHAPLK